VWIIKTFESFYQPQGNRAMFHFFPRSALHDIDKEYFLLLVLGLSDEQARGLTSMYGITFVNEKNFIDHVSALLH
ncbi:MAG: hypothetical protein LUQ57_02210, partial [Methylococcaceae bacterium]|nr:hypothetical protein [Methylococcaceae bacterium]